MVHALGNVSRHLLWQQEETAWQLQIFICWSHMKNLLYQGVEIRNQFSSFDDKELTTNSKIKMISNETSKFGLVLNNWIHQL